MRHHRARPGQIVQMSNGCICCTIPRGDLHAALCPAAGGEKSAEAAGLRPRIIETTGLAGPGIVARTQLTWTTE